ncbi:sodium- and chloride-dependent glycine transporter 2-like isoform X1 [Biomphalaria glabrata]|uniref:Transporter n=2 Tax=Biomphalaria glabrata TaxID=6526 RepID=A0A9W2YSC1_BIOGL|nr:sodium- and chloride-dependent glycine transporter 2-like isoform X1 [Biomphalaria glabrata]
MERTTYLYVTVPRTSSPTMVKTEKDQGFMPVRSNEDSEKVPDVIEESDHRGNWSRKLDFFLSCLSYAVGLGNVWRFPYVCYKNGGGAFLIPFAVMLFITGIPMVFLELSFGQFASSGVVSIWSVSPFFQGVGWAMFIVSCLIAIYYNMIIAWTLYYLFASFQERLPWSYCGDWSSENCLADHAVMYNCTFHNGVWLNETCYHSGQVNESYFNYIQGLANSTNVQYTSSSDEYFHKVVLDITKGIESIGGVKWELALCLLLAWTLVCICLAKGIKSSGKAVYFTAFFPYLVLTILLVRGLTLPGSKEGILYYLIPKWDQLLNAKVWKDAAVQIFFSLSPCWGGLITLASYNKFKNNCLFDAVLVSILDSLTSVFAGLVIFSIIGYMAHELHQSVENVARDGPGLAFIVYPEVVTKLPVSQLWSVLFFLMLITLGLGTQIATVTTVHTTILDTFTEFFRPGKRSFILLLSIAVVGYLIGLSFCTQGGMYVVQLFDNYAATYSLLFIGLIECLALSYAYGANTFLDNIELMLGRRPSMLWKISWSFLTPAALLTILIFTAVDFDPTSYGDYVFPTWAEVVGCFITILSISAIPLVALCKVVQGLIRLPNIGLLEVIKMMMKPTNEWGPRLKEHRELMKVSPDTYESQRCMMLNDFSSERS